MQDTNHYRQSRSAAVNSGWFMLLGAIQKYTQEYFHV